MLVYRKSRGRQRRAQGVAHTVDGQPYDRLLTYRLGASMTALHTLWQLGTSPALPPSAAHIRTPKPAPVTPSSTLV
jgi:hypothetical protein